MKAAETKLLDFLERGPQFEIPNHQRPYSWKKEHCEQLWEDILEAGKSGKQHFIGSIIYFTSENDTKLVIDGQQRLITVTLLLIALVNSIGSDEVDGISADEIKDHYLLNISKNDKFPYKLILSHNDKESLNAIIKGNKVKPNEPSIEIDKNFEYFQKQIDKVKNKEKIYTLWKGLKNLEIVWIGLNPESDNPQRIFESMNSTGLTLTNTDLVRNFVLMHQDQNRLFDDYWKKMEDNFKSLDKNNYKKTLNNFIKHYLAAKTHQLISPSTDKFYKAFKEYFKNNFSDESGGGNESLLKDLKKYAKYYCKMALDEENDSKLKQAFQDIRRLTNTAYPFLLELYDDYEKKFLLKKDFLEILSIIEAYVFRRSICDLTRTLNRTFSTFFNQDNSFNKDNYIQSIKNHLSTKLGSYHFPEDEEFSKKLQEYKFNNHDNILKYLLEKLEKSNSKEYGNADECQIEHIMPQTLSTNDWKCKEWKAELGNNWEEIHKTHKDRLGNLTLTGYNPEYSNYPFRCKCNMENGFRDSPLRLNKDLVKNINGQTWDESAIKARGERLAIQACTIWPRPELSQKILEKEPATSYSIEDHPYLNDPFTRKLFEAFRSEVKALGMDYVYEKILKKYIAYKVDTGSNFVEVESQAKSLNLYLDLPFADIKDPRRICKDVTDLGSRGTGDVKVNLDSLDNLSYIIDLVRQALEYQLGNEEIE